MNRFSWLKPKPSELLTPSVILLIAANLVPLYGVLFLRWEIFPILLIFWMENVLVGVFNVFKMLLSSPSKPINWVAKVFMIPFFCFHYGMFTFVHGVFVFGFFGGYFTTGSSFPNENSLFQAISDFQLGWAFLALFLSHACSFVINYVSKGEYKQASIHDLMMQPYNRVVVLHITILIGGFLVMLLGSPVFALLILVLLKCFIDIQSHVREHKRYADQKEISIERASSLK
jgi:uncharacterized membrane protein